MKRPVEQKDLLDFHFLAAPTFSPDGEKIAFKVSRADVESNGYLKDIWLLSLSSGEARRLTSSGCEECFCWSEDGTSIVFASKRPAAADHGEEKAVTRFYSIGIDGGEATPLFEAPHAVSAIRALKAGRYLLTANFDPVYDNPEDADFMIFEQVPFMANGKGYIGQRRVGLATCDASGRLSRLTPPTMDVARVELSADGDKALVVACDYKDVKPLENSVYMLDLSTGNLRPLSGALPFTFKCAVWSGESVVLTATDHKAMGVNENPKIWLLEDGEMRCLTPELDVSFGHAIVADTSYGCRDHEGAIAPSKSLGMIACSTDAFKARLYALAQDGRLKVLTPAVSSVIDWDVHDDRIAYVAYEGLHLPELYLYQEGKERRLTSFNDAFFEERRLSQPIHITFKAGDGWELDGWYMRPVDAREGERCPTVLNIHGGPKAAFGDIYNHEMQCWAARGYAVIYCNPRGGDGRGGAFSDIRGRYGDIDYRNLMDFADWCVKNLDFIDASRMGVTGGSYGGYMTNWIITQTNRFKAAVSQRSIANWISKFGGCDIGYYYVEDQHLGTPWRKPETAWRESPVAHADKADTPTLFIHSTEDFRCELNQGFQMFTALKVNGVEARMCVFKGENHELSRSGRPRNRLARLREIVSWFDRHLKA